MTSTSKIATNYHRQANKVVIWCFSILVFPWGNTWNTRTTKTLISYILRMVRMKQIKPGLLVYFVLTFSSYAWWYYILPRYVNVLLQDHYLRHLRKKTFLTADISILTQTKRSATPTTDKHHSTNPKCTEGHTIIPMCEARLRSTTKLKPNARWIHK